jgi:hypothetical protein
VPDRTVRAAFHAVVERAQLQDEGAAPTAADERTDWAWAVAERAAAGGPGVLLPRRMRRIDARIAAAGATFAPAEMASYDKGPAVDDPVTGRDFATFAAAAVLAGGSELAGPALAPHIRALLPPGALSPVASWLEYPDGPGRDPSEIHDGVELSLLPTGDVRADLLNTIDEATPQQLRAAWQAAAQMRTWALTLCAAVEAELDTGQLGAATMDWMLGTVLGLARLLMREVLRTRRHTLADQAATALMLLGIGAGLQRLRILVPDGQFDLLPTILPPFLHPLAGLNR